MYQLFIFFMITDPRTVVRGRRRQIVVAVLIAVMETLIRFASDQGWPLPTAFNAAPAFLALATRGSGGEVARPLSGIAHDERTPAVSGAGPRYSRLLFAGSRSGLEAPRVKARPMRRRVHGIRVRRRWRRQDHAIRAERGDWRPLGENTLRRRATLPHFSPSLPTGERSSPSTRRSPARSPRSPSSLAPAT